MKIFYQRLCAFTTYGVRAVCNETEKGSDIQLKFMIAKNSASS